MRPSKFLRIYRTTMTAIISNTLPSQIWQSSTGPISTPSSSSDECPIPRRQSGPNDVYFWRILPVGGTAEAGGTSGVSEQGAIQRKRVLGMRHSSSSAEKPTTKLPDPAGDAVKPRKAGSLLPRACLWFRHLRAGLAAQADLLRQCRTLLGIGWGDHWIIIRQAPFGTVVLGTHVVGRP